MRDEEAVAALVGLGVTGLTIWGAMRARTSSPGATGPALVLRRFHAQEVAAPGEPLVVVEGRRPGLLGYVLTAVGIDASTTLQISSHDITVRRGSLFGKTTTTMPLTAVASLHAGSGWPIGFLVAGGIFILFGMMGLFRAAVSEQIAAAMSSCVTFLIGGGFIAACFLNKRFMFSVETTGGASHGIAFKPSVIEGVPVDENRVQLVVELTKRLILAAHGVSVPAQVAAQQAQHPAQQQQQQQYAPQQYGGGQYPPR